MSMIPTVGTLQVVHSLMRSVFSEGFNKTTTSGRLAPLATGVAPKLEQTKPPPSKQGSVKQTRCQGYALCQTVCQSTWAPRLASYCITIVVQSTSRLLDDILVFSSRSDEQDDSISFDHCTDKVTGGLEQWNGLLKVDDMKICSFGMNVGCKVGVERRWNMSKVSSSCCELRKKVSLRSCRFRRLGRRFCELNVRRPLHVGSLSTCHKSWETECLITQASLAQNP